MSTSVNDKANDKANDVLSIFSVLNRKIAADAELKALVQGVIDWILTAQLPPVVQPVPASALDVLATDATGQVRVPTDDLATALEIAGNLEKRAAAIASWIASGNAPSDWLLTQLEYSSYRLRGLEHAYQTLAAGLRASQFDQRGLEIAALAQNMVLHWIETLALRVGIFDHEQRSAFRWLRHQGEARQHFLYGLSKDHKVELTQVNALRQEAEAILAAHSLADAGDQAKPASPATAVPMLSPAEKAHLALLKKVGFHRKKLSDGDSNEWGKLLPLLAQLASSDPAAVQAELALLRDQKIPLALMGQYVALRELCLATANAQANAEASDQANTEASDQPEASEMQTSS
jgi:hypothetical protein